MMAIDGAVVTIDAMGCQRAIARKIVDKKADYILALKGNQGTLREDVKLFAAEQKAKDFKDTTVTRHETVDGDHGRIETRDYTVIHDVAWLKERHDWPGLDGVVMVDSTRELGGKIEHETRFYITSLSLPAEMVGPMIRDHWAVENSLHWVMDMVFRDDECRVRTDNAPPTSPRSSTSPSTSSNERQARIPCAESASSPPGTTTSSQASSPHDSFTRFPWVVPQGYRIWPRTDLAKASDHPERFRLRRMEMSGLARLSTLRASFRMMARFSAP